MRVFITLFSLLCLTIHTSAFAASDIWEADYSQSHLRFSGTHTGNPFTGEFTRWKGEITFNPEALDASHVKVMIDLTSATTGNATYDGTLPQSDWFATENGKPNATGAIFESTQFTHIKDDSYSVTGDLILREKTVPVTLEATITITEDHAKAHATTTLKRMDFDIGAGSDPSGDWVSAEIPVEIEIVANRQAE